MVFDLFYFLFYFYVRTFENSNNGNSASIVTLYRVSYRDGVMEHEPRPCAAVKGTQIMVRYFSLSI